MASKKTEESASTSASYSFTVRLQYPNRPGMFGKIASVIGTVGGSLGAVDLVEMDRDVAVRDLTIDAHDIDHVNRITEAIRKIEGMEIRSLSDRTFLSHLGGKLSVESRVPLKTRDDLSMVYTPGVARVCRAIAADPLKAWSLTIKKNTVAIVSDGTAVLGLGNIGALAALPVMEGKAVLFKEFGGVDAFPICLDVHEPDEIVAVVKAIAPTFGGVNLEDISSPRCFEIEDRLKKELDIPVFHDDQHGTAVVVLAALYNAVKIVKKRLRDLRVAVAGVGAAGVACTKILQRAGVRDIVGCDSRGIVSVGRREGMNPVKEWYARHTNPAGLTGGLAKAVRGRDLFLGVSGPNTLSLKILKTMASGRIVFAMANPDPEIMPELARPHVAVMATGRSDYPNQINNVLCFPGLFKGALAARVANITEPMKIAAARAIASIVKPAELGPDYIVPSVFNRAVAEAVSRAVIEVAHKTGEARRTRTDLSHLLF